MATAVRISRSSVRRIWAGQGLQPHQVRTLKISNDIRRQTQGCRTEVGSSRQMSLPKGHEACADSTDDFARRIHADLWALERNGSEIVIPIGPKRKAI